MRARLLVLCATVALLPLSLSAAAGPAAVASAAPAAPGLPEMPAGLDARARADFILGLPTFGRTPQEWIDAARSPALQGLAAPGAPAPAPADLDAALAAAYASLGVAPSAQDLASAHAASAAVPVALRGALGGLVAAVAQAYAAQAEVARAVEARVGQDGPLLQPAEREASAQRAAAIALHADAFASAFAVAAAAPPPLPLCLLPVDLTAASLGSGCLAWLGGCGDDLYARNAPPFPLPDPVLIVEPCGNDTYTTSAGGASPFGMVAPANFLALSAVIDVDGDDLYSFVGSPEAVQGAGSFGGLGILVDRWGDDTYLANQTRSAPSLFFELTTVGLPDIGAQGYGFGGVGVLLDGWGQDVYDYRLASEGLCVWGYAQGSGVAGGLGIASDAWGDDDWLATGGGIVEDDPNCVLLGIYAQGVGAVGGIGLNTDSGLGDDLWHVYNNATVPDTYGQGYGIIGGLGILSDDGGTDSFISSQTTTVAPFSLNCAMGGGQGGVGILLEGVGDTRYLIETTAPVEASAMGEGWGQAGYGLLVDLGGADTHVIQATAPVTHIAGRGATLNDGPLLGPQGSIFGTYLDLGGDVDSYVGPPDAGAILLHVGPDPAPNDSIWDGGADL